MAEKEVRKTTTKRAVRRTATRTVPARTTARQAGVGSVRKAPTRVTASGKTRRSSKGLIVGISIFVLLIGASAGIGFSDKGQLNVENIIALRKQNASPEEKVTLETVPVQQPKNNIPNGGLVGMDQSELPPPPVVETSSTTNASSTSTVEESSDASASSTEEAIQAEEASATETQIDPVAQ